jgi:dihydrofolate reductase
MSFCLQIRLRNVRERKYSLHSKRLCKEDEHVYIIGGASVYQQALPFADELCLTEIDNTAPEADAFFPEISPAVWHEKNREAHPADEKHLCSYAFVDYVKA